MIGSGGPASGPPPGPARPAEVARAAAVEPEVSALRTALDGVTAVARAPAPAAAAGRLDRAVWGAGQVVHAALLLLEDRSLRRAALVPTALTFAGCVACAALVTAHRAADGEVGDAAAALNGFTVVFVALASMPPTLLQRLWLRVAREARRAQGLLPGAEPPPEPFLRTALRETRKAIRQAVVVSMGIAPILLVVRLLPFGRTESAAAAALWAFYWIVIDALELPFELLPGVRAAPPAPWYARGLARLGAAHVLLRPAAVVGRLLSRLTGPWHDEVEFTERHPWEVAGCGAAVAALLAVPVVGLFFRSAAIVATTGLHGRLVELPPPLPPGEPPVDR